MWGMAARGGATGRGTIWGVTEWGGTTGRGTRGMAARGGAAGGGTIWGVAARGDPRGSTQGTGGAVQPLPVPRQPHGAVPPPPTCPLRYLCIYSPKPAQWGGLSRGRGRGGSRGCAHACTRPGREAAVPTPLIPSSPRRPRVTPTRRVPLGGGIGTWGQQSMGSWRWGDMGTRGDMEGHGGAIGYMGGMGTEGTLGMWGTGGA